MPLCSVVSCPYHLEGSSIAKQTGLSGVGKILSDNITIYRLGRHCIILGEPELVSSCILYELVAGAAMCVLNLSRLRSGVSFMLTQCSGSSPSPIAGQARDYRSEDIHEFSLFEIINCAHLKFTVYASKQTANIIHMH